MTVASSPQIVTNGLMLYLDGKNTKSYPGTGTAWNDLTTNANNFTAVGSPPPVFSSDGFLFPNNNTSYFNANTPVNFRMGTSSFTAGLWLKQNDTDTNNVLEARASSNIGYTIQLNFPTLGKISVFLNQDSNQNVYTTVRSDLTSLSVINLAVVVDRTAATVQIYNNGALWETITGIHANSISPSASDRYSLGMTVGATTPNYTLYAHALYSRALSAAEVAQNFNALRGRYGI